jgi:hypothetical protein
MRFHVLFGPFEHPAQNTPRLETISDIFLRALLRYPDRAILCHNETTPQGEQQLHQNTPIDPETQTSNVTELLG